MKTLLSELTQFVLNRVKTGLSESKNVKGDSEAIAEYALDILEAIHHEVSDDNAMDIAEAIAEKLTRE